jgi:hypothetical protein
MGERADSERDDGEPAMYVRFLMNHWLDSIEKSHCFAFLRDTIL